MTIQPWCDLSSHLLPTGNLRGYNVTAPGLAAPSLTPPQMVTPNLQQFFPQATRQSLLGPPPVGVPIKPQLNHSRRNSQKQGRTSSSTTPNRKVSGALSGVAAVGEGWRGTPVSAQLHVLGLALAFEGHVPSLCLSVCKMKVPNIYHLLYLYGLDVTLAKPKYRIYVLFLS